MEGGKNGWMVIEGEIDGLVAIEGRRDGLPWMEIWMNEKMDCHKRKKCRMVLKGLESLERMDGWPWTKKG